ncbi:hypothetical protein BpHYR1_048700 [Brachionus plicatilis]|uniref:Uncharacterized protein n=1 Tax=Brachionus plicatilis TaxID=10195 RepID=A0A3M7S4R9_BRAPC|nr:hypothetical protein BpHYR1_048700 [Brachionus plicatilis]
MQNFSLSEKFTLIFSTSYKTMGNGKAYPETCEGVCKVWIKKKSWSRLFLFLLKYTGCQKKETSCRYLVFIVVGNFWPLVLFCTFWSLEVVGDWTLANNQSSTTSKDNKIFIFLPFFWQPSLSKSRLDLKMKKN